MSNKSPISTATPSEREESPTPSPRCAFYQASMHSASFSAHQRGESAPQPESKTLTHRCLLNPGKGNGPDGNNIGLSECTLVRQAQCQAQRRQTLARLHATLPSLRAAS